MIGKEVRYLSLNELMISLSVLYGIILMILQKIENLTQLSFTEGTALSMQGNKIFQKWASKPPSII